VGPSLFFSLEPFLYCYVRFRFPRSVIKEREMEVSGSAQTPYYSLITEGKNPRGIPGAKFIDNIEDFLHSTNLEAALGALNELYSKVGSHFHHSPPHYLTSLSFI
jgi:predicted oxidoreductase